MCGRFTLKTTPEALREAFPEFEIPKARPRYNVAPTQQVLTAAATRGPAEWMRWGLIPSWAKDPSIGYKLINARADGVATKPSFVDHPPRRRAVHAGRSLGGVAPARG